MVCGSDVKTELQQGGDCKACQHSGEEGEAPQLLHPLFLQGSEVHGAVSGSSMHPTRHSRPTCIAAQLASGLPDPHVLTNPSAVLFLQAKEPTTSLRVLFTNRCQRYMALFSVLCSRTSARHCGSRSLQQHLRIKRVLVELCCS